MAGQKKKTRTKKPTKCPCLNGWVCKDHPSQPWGHRGCEAAGSFARIYGATKIRILFFYPSTVGYNQEEEKRQLENWNYQRGAKDCMRLSDSTRPIIFGCILAIGITLTQPYLAFGTGQSFVRSGSVGASRMYGHRFGFFGVDGLGDQQIMIIIQQSPPEPTAELSKPAENRIYVQPRWVDGRYGAQVLEPG
jgi:hypothetical protein